MNYLLFLSNPYHDNLAGIEKHLPIYLSKKNNVICFEHPQFLKSYQSLYKKKAVFETISASFTIFHSIGFLPFGRYFSIVNTINYRLNIYLFNYLLVKKKLFENNYDVITFTPEIVYTIQLLFKYKKIIFYICDNYKGLPYWNSILQRKQYQKIEREILTICDKVIVVSSVLFQKYKNLHHNVNLFPTPSHSDIFYEYSRHKKINPIDIKKISHPIAGFEGNFLDWKINMKFILQLIKTNRLISFVFIGSIQIKNKKLLNELMNLPNVYNLGKKEKLTNLPKYVDQFDVCLIPYCINTWGKSAYPVKIMEYLALGKPVVTTALPSIKNLGERGLIYWSNNNIKFNKNMSRALNEKCSLDLKRRRIAVALKNDWGRRIKQFLKLINA